MLVAFLGNVCNFMVRTNINVAIVEMVNPAGSHVNGSTLSSSTIGMECPFPDNFYGEETIVNWCLYRSGFRELKRDNIFPQSTNNPSDTQIQQNDKVSFDWNPEQQGIILGSYFYGNIPSLLFSGAAANKFGGRWLFGIGMVVTAIATLMNPLAAIYGGETGIVIARVFIGIAMVNTYAIKLNSLHGFICSFQGIFWGGQIALITKWIPKQERTFAVTFIYSGKI